MAFATLTMCQLFHAFNVRSEEQSLFRMGPLSNPAMVRAFVTGMLLQLAVLLLPPLQGVFSVIPMDGEQWLAVLLLAALFTPVVRTFAHYRRSASARRIAPKQISPNSPRKRNLSRNK